MTDVTVISNVMMADGIGRQGVGIIKCIKDSLDVNLFQIGSPNYKDVPSEVIPTLIKPMKDFGKISFWTYILGLNEDMIKTHASLKSKIKIAYSMFESDMIPPLWVKILNSYYDMVVVPDAWHIKVYQNSGVKIPIFVIPLGIMVEDLLNKPLKGKNDIFTFGMSAGFWQRKNHIKLLQAFAKNFGNNSNFKLKLHGRFGPYKSLVQQAVQEYNLNNVELLDNPLSGQEYANFMDSIDCYVFPSQGEGFSVTPREAIALGKPCILSNNTAHKTICNSGLVIPLKAENKVPAIYEVFRNAQLGYFYDCSVEDLAATMKDAVDNYDIYFNKVSKGREWSKQYLWSSLKPIYLNMFKPKNIVLGSDNQITESIFQTNNKNLINKFK